MSRVSVYPSLCHRVRPRRDLQESVEIPRQEHLLSFVEIQAQDLQESVEIPRQEHLLLFVEIQAQVGIRAAAEYHPSLQEG